MTIAHPPSLSKSTFLMGRQCSKLLWFRYNARDQIPAPDEAQQAVFDQGHEVGNLAKQLFPGGIEVSADVTDFAQVLQRSLEAAKARKPLFEAGFVYNGGFARADILNPVGRNEWDIIEVKSSTEVKDVNVLDLAFQAFVYNGAGLNIRRCYLMHVDRNYVRRGAVDPKKFFKLADVTKDVSGLSREIEPQLEDMFATIRLKQEPEIKIGPHCSDPYDCPLTDRCWAFLPPDSVFNLYYGGKKCWRLLHEGVVNLKDIPDDVDLTDRQTIQRKVAGTGQPHIDRKALASFLKRLKYPVSYLDFETFSTAIPLFDGLSPWQQVAFQFSLHRQAAPGVKPEHHAFLADGCGDPRPDFLHRLCGCIGDKGSVIVYNAKFEVGVLDALADAFPEHVVWIEAVKPRIIDLLEPFQAFDYYHPEQYGSASIKAVLPVLTGRSYTDLEIQEGNTASLEFLRVHFGGVAEAERQKVRGQLERYCSQDTEGMIWITDALRQLTG
ncbi:MAG: hypothetical protein BWX84_00285 [Verrucomicrobia bacterium ADurb.Bin118]|jgi:hypothetical protein|nr:MAG: hypothetical protein BWX84_00285 [Verrucomicrobia bacterium ADurb.Bin118]